MPTRWGCQRQQPKCNLWNCCRKGILLRTGVECTQREVDLAINGSCTMRSLPCSRYPPFKPHSVLISRLPVYIKQQEVIVSARKEAGLVNPETGQLLEIDVFVPSLRLAFEFQVGYNFTLCVLFYICFFLNDFFKGEA